MSARHPAQSEKIVNGHLARLALHGAEAFGAFRVIVKLARRGKLPSYMKPAGLHSPGQIEAWIDCDQIERVMRDANVVSVELCEHVM